MQRQNSTQGVCYAISGRDFLRQDSLNLWTNDAITTADGNVLVCGEYADYRQPWPNYELGAYCMKTDFEGNIIWATLFDSTADTYVDYIYYFKALELKNGSILIAGRTSNRISKNDDLIFTKLDNNGNLIWSKTYESKFWQGFNGSGDYFNFHDLVEDPNTGEIYFDGSHWGGINAITKLDPNDGHIIWSTGYRYSSGDNRPAGLIVNPANLIMFELENGSSNESIVHVTFIDKLTSDTISSKHFAQTGDLYAARIFTSESFVKLNNGHYRISGPTTRYFEFPNYTGTIDLYHAAIVELDENFNFYKAWGIKNRVESNGYNTKISLFPDGSGVFTMLDLVYGGFVAEAHISLFRDDQIYHQRTRLHNNEGIPYEPYMLQLPDGGFLGVKLMGDSTYTANDGSRIEYYRMHTSDTASVCLGVKDSSTTTWSLNFEPYSRRIYEIHKNVLKESRIKKYDQWSFGAEPGPSCVVTSNCDTLKLEVNTTTICQGSTIQLTVHKNKACGSLVPLVFDPIWQSDLTKLNDSTYNIRFQKEGEGYIYGSLLGCILRKDSLKIKVTPAVQLLNLGIDTVICPGNQFVLNAGAGFVSYEWQDGTIGQTINVTVPGKYFVTAINSCGTVFSDTIYVNPHPPIPFDVGPDRIKCNQDTLKLTAPAGFLNYSWLTNYNISSTSAQQVTINPLMDTSYIVKAEKKPGCFAYDTIRVKVNTSPPIYLGKDTSICSGDQLLLDAGIGFQNYEWSTGSIGQQLYIKDPGKYFIKATMNNGCSSADTISLLSLYTNPFPDLGPDGIICAGDQKTVKPKGNYSSYLWSNGQSASSIIVNTTGQYWVKVIDVNGCRGADTMNVTNKVNIPANFLDIDTSICSYGNLLIQPLSTFDQYKWSTGTSSSSITVTQPGEYWLEVTDKNLCKGKDSIKVALKECMEGLYVPNAFTPNGDGKNEVFMPLLFGDVKSFSFAVYNRWGEIVFRTNQRGSGWNGNYKGVSQDSNVFLWICTYLLNGQKVEKKKGTVMLIR